MNATPQLPADLQALRDAIVELLTTAGAVSETAWDAPAGEATVREGFDQLFTDLMASKAKAATIQRWAKTGPNEKKWVDPTTYWAEGEGQEVVKVLKKEFVEPQGRFTKLQQDHGSRDLLALIFKDAEGGEYVLGADEAPKLWDALNNGQDPTPLLKGLNKAYSGTTKRTKGSTS